MTASLVIVFILTLLSCKAKGCARGGRTLLAQERSAQDIIQSWKNDFDINVHFGLRKIGLGSGGAGKKVFFRGLGSLTKIPMRMLTMPMPRGAEIFPQGRCIMMQCRWWGCPYHNCCLPQLATYQVNSNQNSIMSHTKIQILDVNLAKFKKESWKFVYILVKQCQAFFDLTILFFSNF